MNNSVPVPFSFIRNNRLTAEERMLYIYLQGFENEFPSYVTMSKQLACSKPKIGRILKSLEEKGGVYCVSQFSKGTKGRVTNTYFLSAIDTKTGDFVNGALDEVKKMFPDKIRYVDL